MPRPEAMEYLNLSEIIEIGMGGVNRTAKRGMYFMHALSYRWLEPGHPDKKRHHLKIVAKVLPNYETVSVKVGKLSSYI